MSIPGLNNTNLSEENLFDIPISLCPRHHKSLEDENWINLLAPSCRMSLGLHRFSRVRMQGWGLPKAMIRPMISYKRYDGIKLQSPRKIFCDLWRKEIRQIFIEVGKHQEQTPFRFDSAFQHIIYHGRCGGQNV